MLDILEKQDAGKLAGLFCALKISRTVACQLLLLLNRNIGRDVTIFRTVTQKYTELSVDHCQLTLMQMGARFGDRELPRPDDSRRTEPEHNLAATLKARRELLFPTRNTPPAQQSMAG